MLISVQLIELNPLNNMHPRGPIKRQTRQGNRKCLMVMLIKLNTFYLVLSFATVHFTFALALFEATRGALAYFESRILPLNGYDLASRNRTCTSTGNLSKLAQFINNCAHVLDLK
jgi:hypothetical protein